MTPFVVGQMTIDGRDWMKEYFCKILISSRATMISSECAVAIQRGWKAMPAPTTGRRR
ncbi:hypothetical protein LR948_18335 [Roseivivax sp. GX 12232]|uniref:hypothetical protein n=1 Tax=Roseivivax sp. GX 12232 TaxID=2900547 RepID=UPI001E2C019A|nr:hypothetical protein [Roseivivax sp. GX 12232]MCE0507322.1 hypothetical protein [Roseivivax sp. GX 12232]